MALIARPAPYGGFNFHLVVDTIAPAGTVGAVFREVQGLDSTVEVREWRNGTDPLYATKIAGLNKVGNVTLKWGSNGTAVFWSWILDAMNGNVRPADGSIIMYDEARAEVMRWNFIGGWPTKYTGPTFNAGQSETAMESLDMTVKRLLLEMPGT